MWHSQEFLMREQPLVGKDSLKSGGPGFLKVVEKVFQVLETLVQSEEGIRISELARILKQPKATIYRILFTLQKLGYVRQNPGTMAYLCTAHAGWITRDRANQMLRKLARSQMERLLARFEQTVNLAIFDRDRMFYLEILDGLRSIRLAATPMTYAPMHSTAVGKSVLAFLHPLEAQQILRQRRLVKHTARTIISERMILGQLKQLRERGYAIDNEETEIGARCIAAPIFNTHGRPVAAVSISGPVHYMKPGLCLQMAKALKVAGSEISAQLGFADDGETPCCEQSR
jgi:IclR family transcriptional regulator, KDG regulon repressor